MFNNAQMIQQMQQSEDAFANTVNELQADRMRLKGKDMLARLVALDSREGAFAQLSGEYQEQAQLFGNQSSQTQIRADGMSIQLNGAEKAKLEGALSSVETLKFRVKKQMASRRIVDLTIPSQPTTTDVTQPEEAIESDRKLQN